MARSYAALPHEYLEEMELLSDEEFGRLCRALLRYSSTGQDSDLTGAERYYWKRVQTLEDRFRKSYEEQALVLSQRGKAGAAARWGNDKNAKACLSIQSNAKNGNIKSKSNNRRLSSSSLSDDDDEKISLISDCFSKNIRKNSQVLKKESKKFLDLGLSTDLICRAIEDAAAHDARSWAYVSKILQQCEAQKIYTAAQFEARVPSSVGGGGKSPGILKGPRTAPKFKK